MKSKMKKKMIAFLLCMVLVICNSVSILADTPAVEATTTEKQAKETRTAKSEGTSEEEKSSDNSKDTSKSSEETEETKEEAPETKTTEKKEETTGATTEKKEESTIATTTEKKEETEESSETSDKKDTEGAEETATTGSEEETSETAEETSESEEETTTEETEETTQSPAYNGKYEDSTVTISVSAEAGIVPEGAELSVTPIEKTKITDSMSDEDKAKAEEVNAQYDLTEKKLTEDSEANEETMEGFLAYDISFIVDGEEVEPNGDVKVVMDFKEAAVPEGVSENATVAVKHLKEVESAVDGIVVEDMAEKATIESTDKAEVQKVEMTSDSFSTFTITWATSGYAITVHYVNEKYQEITSDNVQKEDIVLDDELREIVLSEYVSDKTITGYTYSGTATIGRQEEDSQANPPEIYSVRVNNGNLQYKRSENGAWQNWESTLGYHVYLKYKTDSNSTSAKIETIDNKAENITINLFDYSVLWDNEYSTYSKDRRQFEGGYKSGINDGKVLKFLSDAPQNTPLDTINEWTGGIEVRKNMVSDSLDNGYPILNSSNEHNSQSLAYLFNDESVTGKTSYFNTNNLLTKDENGYYSFDSDSNYAEFNTLTKNFTVYSNPLSDTIKTFYLGDNQTPYQVTGLKGFYPFDSYKKVADNYINATRGDNKGNYYYSSGWGIEAGSANHYFGMAMSAQFYYPKDGQINGNDMIFEFSGDDDVWVFIDGKLVLDLGGIHDRASGSINFATGEVKVNGVVQNGKGLFDILNRDTFDDYSQHTIKFFYLERGNNASNCKLKFNLPTIPENSAMVGKEVTGESGESLDYAQDVNYQFQITKEDKIVANTEYEIRNSSNEVIGSDTTDSEGKFTLKDGQFAIFKDFLATDTYKVKEIGANLDDGYNIQINGTTVEIIDEEGETDQILQSASSGNLTAGVTSGVIFRNEIENTGKLIISKTLASGSESALANQNFEINVWINGERYNGSYTLKADGSTETKTASNGMISLKGNQTAEITGLPYGATFKVEEDKGSNYYPKYSLTEKGNYYDEEVPTYDENGVIKSGSQNVSAKIAGDCRVTIENREVEGGTTSVTVNKTWADNIDEQYQVPVEITLYSGEEGSGTKVVRRENDNPYVLNKKNNWTHTWDNLPGDTNYYVTETTKGFNYVPSYSYSYEINDNFKRITPCNNTYYPLGANGIIVIKKTQGDGALIWTSEKIQDDDTTAKENIIKVLKDVTPGINYDKGVDFVSGSTTYSFGDDGRTITFSYDDGNVLLEFNAEKTWTFFYMGTYDKTITATVTNSIKDDATIDIPVEKVWEDGDGTNRPKNVTVQLYKKTSAGIEKAVPGQEVTLNDENYWKDSFKNLPYWDGTERIEYVVKEVKVGNESLLDSGYQSSITGNADAGFIITNSLAWQLAKISSTTGNSGQKIYLAGAEFTATTSDESNTYYGKSDVTSGIIQWYEKKSGDDFTDPIGTMLPNGTYTITETKAPTGYQITDSGWTLTIVNGYPTNVQEGQTNVKTGVEGKTNTFYLENEALYDLPSAGGPGIYWYTLSGTLLMAGAALIVYREKRKREVLLRK